MAVLGIDIGGSAIKGALVDVQTGALVASRHRLPTPDMVPPEEAAAMVNEIRTHFNYNGPIGVGFPAVVLHGVCYSAANIHQDWVGADVSAVIARETGCKVLTINDADAAGIAEMTFGAGRGYKKGVVMLLTVGTGIGSAFFTDGHLLPNTEFGHVQIRGKDAERRASDAARQRKKMTWEEWSENFQEYLEMMEFLFSPDLIIVGGGIVKSTDKFLPLLHTRAKLVPAELGNEAGIIGAAMYASNNAR